MDKQERERIALHLDILAQRVVGHSLTAHRAIVELADQVRRDALPVVFVEEPGPDVRLVYDPRGNPVRRALNGPGWEYWGGRGGSRTARPWEWVRDGFGPLLAERPAT